MYRYIHDILLIPHPPQPPPAAASYHLYITHITNNYDSGRCYDFYGLPVIPHSPPVARYTQIEHSLHHHSSLDRPALFVPQSNVGALLFSAPALVCSQDPLVLQQTKKVQCIKRLLRRIARPPHSSPTHPTPSLFTPHQQTHCLYTVFLRKPTVFICSL